MQLYADERMGKETGKVAKCFIRKLINAGVKLPFMMLRGE